MVDRSKEKGWRNIVIVFHPHPRTVLSAGNNVKIVNNTGGKEKSS